MGDYKITRLNVPNFSDAFFGLALFVSLFPVLRFLLLILDSSSTRLLWSMLTARGEILQGHVQHQAYVSDL